MHACILLTDSIIHHDSHQRSPSKQAGISYHVIENLTSFAWEKLLSFLYRIPPDSLVS